MKLKDISLLLIVLLVTLSIPVQACEFYFNYSQIEAPLGTTGSIGVRVFKEHQDCCMENMDGYQLEWDKIQVLEETEWSEIDNNLYEKRLRIALSEVGDGFFKISKDCTREGYDEDGIPIIVHEGGEDWNEAYHRQNYPYETELEVQRAAGTLELVEGGLEINGEKRVAVPSIPAAIEDYNGHTVIYYSVIDGNKEALLMVGEDIFYPFNHY